MISTRHLLLLAALVFITQCKAVEQTRFSVPSTTPYGVCYAKVTPEQVEHYNMVIVEPDFYTRHEMDQLRVTGTKIIAYMTLGEVDRNRWYYPLLEEQGFVGVNEAWDSPYLDLADEKTRAILLDKVLPEIMVKEVDGIFLDTIDAVAPYTERRHLESYMVGLIHEIRNRYPDTIIIQNAGLFLLDKTSEQIDAVVFESVASNYNFAKQEYLIRDLSGFRERVSLIETHAQESGKPFYIIDFAVLESSNKEVRARLDSLGYPYFISNIGLSELPAQPDDVANNISE